MLKNSRLNSRGYSLVEIVVYVSILAIIAVLVVGSILSVYRSFAQLRVGRKISLNGDVALETMVRDIRNATSTDTGASILGTHPGVLKIDEKTFSISGTTLQVQEGMGAPQNITTSDVRVTNLVFYHTEAVSTGLEIVKIEMTIEAGSNIFLRERNFFGSAVLRRAY